MKNRQGFAMGMVLIIFTILMVFGTVIIGVANNESKSSINHEHKTEAYYIARSGAEAVEAYLLSLTVPVDMEDENKGELSEIEELYKLLDENHESLEIEDIDFDGDKAQIRLSRVDGNLEIESSATIKGITQTVTKVLVNIGGVDKVSGETPILKHAVYSKGDVSLQGSSKIEGSLVIKDGNLTRGWSTTITGDIDQNNTSIEYPAYSFPDFPEYMESKGSLETLWGKPIKITESGHYTEIKITSSRDITIDTSKGDIILAIEKLELIQGQIIIEGQNNVKIYAKEMPGGLAGSSKINENKESSKVQIYYYGKDKLRIGGSFAMNAYLFIKEADLDFGGSGNIIGNIVSGGKITVTGSSSNSGNFIYAPNAEVSITSSGKVNGAIVAKKFEISGSGTVTYNPDYIDMDFIIDNLDKPNSGTENNGSNDYEYKSFYK